MSMEVSDGAPCTGSRLAVGVLSCEELAVTSGMARVGFKLLLPALMLNFDYVSLLGARLVLYFCGRTVGLTYAYRKTSCLNLPLRQSRIRE